MYRSLNALALTFAVLFAAPSLSMAGQWDYRNTRDELRRTDTVLARLAGDSLTTPRDDGALKLDLLLRRGPQGEDAYFSLGNGEFDCTPEKCAITARLDDGEIMTWDAVEGSSASTLFVHSSRVFTESVRLGRRLIVEVAVRGRGNRQVAFDVQNLDWPQIRIPATMPKGIGGIAWAGTPPSHLSPMEDTGKTNSRCYTGAAPTEAPWNTIPIENATYCFVNDRFAYAMLKPKRGVDAGRKLLRLAKKVFGEPALEVESYARWAGLEADQPVQAMIYVATKTNSMTMLMVSYEPLQPHRSEDPDRKPKAIQ